MKNFSFVIVLGLLTAAYFLGDFNSLFGVVPEGGSTLNAWMKGLIAAAAVYVVVRKSQDFIKVNAGLSLLLICSIGVTAYVFEAGKEQRQGRKVLASLLGADAASGAWISHKEGGKWGGDSVILIGFNQPLDQKKMFPNFREIPYCNILFPDADKLLTKIPPETLEKSKFYWSSKGNASTAEYTYQVVAVLPDEHNWFYQSAPVTLTKAPQNEVIENARSFNSDGSYVDRQCGHAPYTFHKKAYNAQNVVISSWDEKKTSDKFNEMVYDRSGKPLNGQVSADFVYFVEKEEEFQKGFGKAGMLKCTGYYTYKDGKKHGDYQFYYPGGIAKAFVGEYENGAQVGTHKQFNPNGTLKKKWEVNDSERKEPALAR